MANDDVLIDVRRQVAIAGRVTNSQTCDPMVGMIVTIIGGPLEFIERVNFLKHLHGVEQWSAMVERLDQTRTVKDGLYYFLDLPDGSYTLEGRFPSDKTTRYDSVQTSAIVSRDGDNIHWAKADMQLPATTLSGLITQSEDDNEPIPMAEVRIAGSGERAFSSDNGAYSLVAIESGERTLMVSAVGYESESAIVAVGPKGTITPDVNFALTAKNSGG